MDSPLITSPSGGDGEFSIKYAAYMLMVGFLRALAVQCVPFVGLLSSVIDMNVVPQVLARACAGDTPDALLAQDLRVWFSRVFSSASSQRGFLLAPLALTSTVARGIVAVVETSSQAGIEDGTARAVVHQALERVQKIIPPLRSDGPSIPPDSPTLSTLFSQMVVVIGQWHPSLQTTKKAHCVFRLGNWPSDRPTLEELSTDYNDAAPVAGAGFFSIVERAVAILFSQASKYSCSKNTGSSVTSLYKMFVDGGVVIANTLLPHAPVWLNNATIGGGLNTATGRGGRALMVLPPKSADFPGDVYKMMRTCKSGVIVDDIFFAGRYLCTAWYTSYGASPSAALVLDPKEWVQVSSTRGPNKEGGVKVAGIDIIEDKRVPFAFMATLVLHLLVGGDGEVSQEKVTERASVLVERIQAAALHAALNKQTRRTANNLTDADFEQRRPFIVMTDRMRCTGPVLVRPSLESMIAASAMHADAMIRKECMDKRVPSHNVHRLFRVDVDDVCTEAAPGPSKRKRESVGGSGPPTRKTAQGGGMAALQIETI